VPTPGVVAATTGGAWLYSAVAVLLVAEAAWPYRAHPDAPLRRWALHAGLFFCARALGWLLAGGMAWVSGQLDVQPRPDWVGWWHLAFVMLALDATHYGVHRLVHRVGLLWNWHRLHHSDTTLDISTTVRHHPLDALISGLAAGTMAVVVGASPVEVAAYATLALGVQAAAHANLRFPLAPPWLGALLVTPAQHHLHHSPECADTDSNYGEVLNLWDRIFGTFNPPRGPVSVFGVQAAAHPDYGVANRAPPG